MSRLYILIVAAFTLFIGFSFAENPTILNPSYTVDGDVVRIFWTDNSNGGYMDVNLQDPETKNWFNFGSVEISDQVFTYTKQRDGDQNVWLIPGDGGDEQFLCVSSSSTPCSVSDNTKSDIIKDNAKSHAILSDSPKSENKIGTVNRTVIPVTPKTGPSMSFIWLIVATLTIFGGYIYIKKRADI